MAWAVPWRPEGRSANTDRSPSSKASMKLAATAFLLLLAACHSVPASQSSATPASSSSAPVTNAKPAPTPADRGVLFHLVLDGLYHEGVDNEDVDVMLARDATTSAFRFFVYACPLCLPTIDALQLYRGRPAFYGLKMQSDTFGDGLPAAESAALRGGDDKAKLAVMHDFVERCVQRKMASLRLTAEERKEWRLMLTEMAAKGGEMLKYARQAGTAGALSESKGCAVCDGMADAGTWMDR